MSALFTAVISVFMADAGFEGTLMKVVDGDTIRVQPVGERKWRTIKLIGIDAPIKATRDEDGQEPWGARSQQFLSLLATRKKVRIEFDVLRPVSSEEPEVVWGYVWLGEQLLNEEVLRNGHAFLATQAPNVKYVERFQRAAAAAREAGIGIWNPEEPLKVPPSDFETSRNQKKIETPDEKPLTAWVEGCVIGNRKSKVYHIPGGRYYEAMKSSRDAMFFRSTAEADRAGFKQAAR